ncbi:MAG: response regulator [Candidatus Saccharimonas sp.]|nr:response regulator [Planctomycetaceae bacterium]
MLVLSRKTDQKIVFPNLGITLKLLSVKGNLARIGIEAPNDMPVMRQELVDESATPPTPYVSRELRHDVRNSLNTIRLAVELFQRQMEAGLPDKAQSTFLKLVQQLGNLDRQFGGSATPEAPAAAPAPRSRVLVVDDDVNERELLAGILELSGWDVATAGDGLEAIEYLTSHERPDYVLLDMRMPRCDGPQTVQLIRGNPDLADLTVFAVSGSDRVEVGVEGGTRGIDRWFSKPLNPATLIQEMNRLPA